ncbi:MAG: alpha-amylase family glycosyl hydrolase [Fimbriimonadaceae bacterium]
MLTSMVVTAILQSAEAREVEFRFSAPPGTAAVAVVGQFNEWDRARHPLKEEAGEWRDKVAIEPGVYQYLFVLDGKKWVRDPAAPTASDANGNTNSKLVVEPVDYEDCPAVPGDGSVTASALRHRPDTRDTVRKNRTEVLLKLMTRKGGVRSVEAVPEGRTGILLRRTRTDELYDYRQGAVYVAPKGQGMRLILDGVFNHSGTGYAPFRSVVEQGEASPVRHFFHVLKLPLEVREGQQTYGTFAGVWQMPKLATHEAAVQRDVAAHGLLNVLGSHDTERLRRIVPDRSRRMAAAAIQFTWPGVPCVYYGDEVGLDGGRDPDDRLCMDWDEAKWDLELLDHYRKLSGLRSRRAALQRGRATKMTAHDKIGLFAFRRDEGQDQVWVVVNMGKRTVDHALGIGTWKMAAGEGELRGASVTVAAGMAAVLVRGD